METLFQNSCSFEEYKYILEAPLEADLQSVFIDSYCHEQYCCAITGDKIKHINKLIIIKDKIECLYFIYINFGEKKWDNKYWFFIGRLNNQIYFAYESGCCGTGFGLGSKSSLYLSKTQELLCKYGLTDKQRELINMSPSFSVPY